jgi:acyl carrier protein
MNNGAAGRASLRLERSTAGARGTLGHHRRGPIDHREIAQPPDELGAESLDVIEIVFGLEEKFDITIPLKAYEASRLAASGKNGGAQEMPFSTVGDVSDLVQKLVEAKVSQ